MRLDRRLGRLNLTDVWRALVPGSPPCLARPAAQPAANGAALEALEAAGTLPIVCFHLGAKAALRRWPVDFHAKMAATLFGITPFLAVTLGSRQERALALKFRDVYGRAAPGAPVADLSGRTRLEDLWALFDKAALLISSDTGIMHLGASLGVPQLAVFAGPAYAHETGPYGEGALVLQGLAPCGPCVENKGCKRPECRALPPWEAALPLAGALLTAAAMATVRPANDGMARDGRTNEDMERDALAKEGMARDIQAKEGMERDGQAKEGMERDALAKDGMARYGEENEALAGNGKRLRTFGSGADKPEAVGFPVPSPPPGMSWESWTTVISSRGASLVPRGPFPAVLDERALAGLMFREGARSVVWGTAEPDDGRKSGEMGMSDESTGSLKAPGSSETQGASEAVCAELSLYRHSSRQELKKVKAFLSYIERKALDASDRKVFRMAWEEALDSAVRQGML
ncbi:MAG: glycosyltransferase family 9 protein [Deltaproteobacteria bacterium]|nr:glycosyltransferase family 9 protein [Deltaproteobacteria bacterium]